MSYRFPLLLSTIGALAIAGCAAPTPTGNPRANAQGGALTGAVIGGLIGASSSEDKLLKAAAGAVVGGALGGAVGSALDRQAADLRRDIGNDQVSITNTGSQLIVTMPQDILFAIDSATLRPDLTRDLGAVAQNLLNYPSSTIQVVGHTDDTGSAAYNLDLSQRRADAVAQVLRGNGVPGSRIAAIGRGEDQPIATNLTTEGRAQNRRVEIIIRPTN